MKQIVLLSFIFFTLLHAETFEVSTKEEMVAALDTSITNGEDDAIVLSADIFLSPSYNYVGLANESLLIKSNNSSLKILSGLDTDRTSLSKINFNFIQYNQSHDSSTRLYCNEGNITNSSINAGSFYHANIINSTIWDGSIIYSSKIINSILKLTSPSIFGFVWVRQSIVYNGLNI